MEPFPMKPIVMYYHACPCWNLISWKLTIVTSETNVGFLHELNPGSAWFSPWNLRNFNFVLLIFINCQTDWHQTLSRITTSPLPKTEILYEFSFCCILICLPYVSYHISAKKQRGLFRLELAFMNPYCCILTYLLYMSYHISVKKHRRLLRLELALWTRIAVFLYACYICHIIFLLRNTGGCFAWNWLYEPVLLHSYMLAICVISYFC